MNRVSTGRVWTALRSAPRSFGAKIQLFVACRRERSPLRRLVSTHCPLYTLGLRSFLIWNVPLSGPPSLILIMFLRCELIFQVHLGLIPIKKWLYASRQQQFFCLIPSSSIPFLFLILLGKKHSCIVHKYFELKTSDGLLALKLWERFGNPIMVRVLCQP